MGDECDRSRPRRATKAFASSPASAGKSLDRRFSLRGAVSQVAGSVVDFLVEDACVLCRRPHAAHRGPIAEVSAPGGYFLEPLPVRYLFRILEVSNRPLCPGCAGRFATARGPGILGHRIGDRSIETRIGGVFGSEDVTPGPVEEPIPDRAGTEIIVVAPFMTNDLILEVIHSLKFRGYNALARPAARAIAWALRNGPVLPGEGSVLVPVPMDDKSLRHRGFNPAERIARELGRELGWPVADILRKSKRTRPQSKTPAEDRAANVRGVFAEGPGAGEPVKDRPVVLVDDLVTTGATAAACGSVLLAAGASRLSVACLGRTM